MTRGAAPEAASKAVRRQRGFVYYDVWILAAAVGLLALIVVPAVVRGVRAARQRRADLTEPLRPRFQSRIALLTMRADSAEQQHRFAGAAGLYEQAFAVSGFQPLFLALAAADAAQAGDSNRAFRDLGRAVDEGFLDPGYFTRDSATFVLHRDGRWPALEARLRARRTSLDSTLMAELIALADSDQLARQSLNDVVVRYGRSSPQGDSVFRALDASDAPRYAQIRAIIAARGWPGRRLVGDEAAHDAWLLVQHAPPEFQKQVLPLLLAAVRKDDARAGDGALLEDRVLVAEGKPQLYGTQTRYSDRPGPPALDSIANEPCVDVRRREVGLEPLAIYLQSLGVEYAGPPGVCRRR
ncbi:MAG TPA: DUF6624 domain-containing protein [Gemmatimonadales bacterium]|nr:DUF6624 domain-containing protein [Gemmatimonadales bacterium]